MLMGETRHIGEHECVDQRRSKIVLAVDLLVACKLLKVSFTRFILLILFFDRFTPIYSESDYFLISTLFYLPPIPINHLLHPYQYFFLKKKSDS